MKTVKLSERLSNVARFIPQGKKVADIGSDHALLPSYLIIEQISPFAIAGEINDGPFQAAKKQISNLQLEDYVSVRKGDGLEVIHDHEVDIITIAGMGGGLIVDILDRGQDKLKQIERLVLQPNVGAERVRKWLDFHQWNIIDEEMIEEDEKIYEIIVAEYRIGPEDPVYMSQHRTKEELYRLGPILWQKQSPVLLKKWKNELKKVKYILRQMDHVNHSVEKDSKKEQLNKEKRWILEVISCLQKANTSSRFLNN